MNLTTADSESPGSEFLRDVVTGLSHSPKYLPSKYFYDRIGSQLFDRICELDEYYLTDAERSIFETYGDEIAEQIGPGAMLVELGSGSSIKTRILLDRLEAPAAYVPVDISEKHLVETAEALRAAYPDLEILPVAADFTAGFELPQSRIQPDHVVVLFPGSTIGNFTNNAAEHLLQMIARIVGVRGGLIIGLDLQKNPQIIEAAYNDDAGVTAQFNLNILARINRELDGDFDLDQFEHRSVYNEALGRIETSLVSQTAQRVTIGDHQFQFGADEPIHTEYSHKYTVEGFCQLAAPSGFQLHRHWLDADRHFAVAHFVV